MKKPIDFTVNEAIDVALFSQSLHDITATSDNSVNPVWKL